MPTGHHASEHNTAGAVGSAAPPSAGVCPPHPGPERVLYEHPLQAVLRPPGLHGNPQAAAEVAHEPPEPAGHQIQVMVFIGTS